MLDHSPWIDARSTGIRLLALFLGIEVFSRAATPSPPSIASLIRPHLMKRVLEDKEIIVNANLLDMPDDSGVGKKYSFYAAMKVGASEALSRKILTRYDLYAKMIPYVDRVDFSPADRTLRIQGGIWGFKLHSRVFFEEKTDRWIHYKVVAGSFSGLEGNLYFESLNEKGSLIYFNGEQSGQNWPPKFVIERGAEIVFRFTANKMRTYIESQKKAIIGNRHGKKQDYEIPEPRSHL